MNERISPPALGLLCMLACAALAIPPPPPGPQALDEQEARLLALVNAERGSRHLAPLKWDATLGALARAHAADMRATGHVSHESSTDGSTYAHRAEMAGVRASAVAENVAMAKDVVSAHRSLMESAGHRKNILDPGLNAIGIGVVPAPEEDSVFVAEDFATLLPSMTEAQAADRIRMALLAVEREAAADGPLAEDGAASSRLRGIVERMAVSDSVRIKETPLTESGWFVSYTSVNPPELPPDARRHARRARSFGVAVVFRRTPGYPFGVWWVALAFNAEDPR